MLQCCSPCNNFSNYIWYDTIFICLFFFQTCMLEKEAYPALDELTSKISTLNLERVRQIKSRLVTISGRVQKVGIVLIFFSIHCHLQI